MTPRHQATVALKPILKKLIPICFLTGAAMEAFMVKTGFCTITYQINESFLTLHGTTYTCLADDIVTVNEAERRQRRDEARQKYPSTRY
ncbi:hypothetical protein Plhal304r1_c028g0092651 [Plasmopara halstedii]